MNAYDNGSSVTTCSASQLVDRANSECDTCPSTSVCSNGFELSCADGEFVSSNACTACPEGQVCSGGSSTALTTTDGFSAAGASEELPCPVGTSCSYTATSVSQCTDKTLSSLDSNSCSITTDFVVNYDWTADEDCPTDPPATKWTTDGSIVYYCPFTTANDDLYLPMITDAPTDQGGASNSDSAVSTFIAGQMYIESDAVDCDADLSEEEADT